MSAERATYLDSSAIVKLAVLEAESMALRRYLRRRAPYVSSALALTEVSRALLPLGAAAQQRGLAVLARLELVRISRDVLARAGTLLPTGLRSLDAIHLATAMLLGSSLGAAIIYDTRLAAAAGALGLRVAAPA